MSEYDNLIELIQEVKCFIDDYLEEKSTPPEETRDNKQYLTPSNTFSLMTMDDIGRFMRNNKKDSESFPNMLNRLVGETDESAASICRKVGLNETLLSKYINGSRNVNKTNLLKLIIGLECNTYNAVDLLELAGFSYNKASNLDLIVMAHVFNRDYSLRSIDNNLGHYNEAPLFNETLYKED